MNNARYVREMDFARFHYYDKTGIYETITKMKGNALQGACNIRYRRTIPIFSFYKVTTKVCFLIYNITYCIYNMTTTKYI